MQTEIRPVVALSLFDATTLQPNGDVSSTSKMLLGIRDPKTNITHPDVLSTPTKRIPHSYPAWLEHERGKPQSSDNSNSVTSFVVSGLVARKLGVADFLTLRAVRFQAQYALELSGRVEHSDAEDECNRMINLRVDLWGAENIPDQTASYSKLLWVSVADFLEMWPGRDVTKVGIDVADALRVCTTGLCVASAYEYLCLKKLPRS